MLCGLNLKRYAATFVVITWGILVSCILFATFTFIDDQSPFKWSTLNSFEDFLHYGDVHDGTTLATAASTCHCNDERSKAAVINVKNINDSSQGNDRKCECQSNAVARGNQFNRLMTTLRLLLLSLGASYFPTVF